MRIAALPEIGALADAAARVRPHRAREPRQRRALVSAGSAAILRKEYSISRHF
jgi:hypothetical protein